MVHDPNRIDPNRVPNSFMSGFGGCLGVGFAILAVMIISLLIVAHGCSSGSNTAPAASQQQPSAAAAAAAAAVVDPASVAQSSSSIPPPPGPCTAVGGTTAEDLNGGPICTQIPYLGTDDQTYYTTVPVNADGSLQAAGNVDDSVTATQDECTRGWYPEYQGIGPTYAAPGHWNSSVGLCLSLWPE